MEQVNATSSGNGPKLLQFLCETRWSQWSARHTNLKIVDRRLREILNTLADLGKTDLEASHLSKSVVM